MRPRQRRFRLYLLALGAVFGAFAAGLVIGSMPSAKADAMGPREWDYAHEFGPIAICPVLAANPDTAGVVGVGLGVMDDGFTDAQAAGIVSMAVRLYCPQLSGVLTAAARTGAVVSA